MSIYEWSMCPFMLWLVLMFQLLNLYTTYFKYKITCFSIIFTSYSKEFNFFLNINLISIET